MIAHNTAWAQGEVSHAIEGITQLCERIPECAPAYAAILAQLHQAHEGLAEQFAIARAALPQAVNTGAQP